MRKLAVASALLAVLATTPPLRGARPSFVDITWFSVTNVYYEIGSLGIVTDGFITRIPQNTFYGGGGGAAHSRGTFKPDVPGITKVLNAFGGRSHVNLLLTGHSHFDHSFDTAAWSTLTGARIIGSRTTCLQAVAQKVPAERCRAVSGGEKIDLADGVTMRVVRLNHSGDPAVNPEQHNPVELTAPPTPDPLTGGLHPGVAEDFPNGGGGRGFLFTVDGPDGPFSWFYENSASAVDLDVPIIVDGVNHGAPFENVKAAMADAKLGSVNLWIGAGGTPIATRLLPVLKPKAYLPVHWDSYLSPFAAGVGRPFSDRAIEDLLRSQNIVLVKPVQYMDKWRLDRTGIRPVSNDAAKRALGF
jgi:L-ascorbate metabolism protein UlaG (beta-lactamase superfamily)